MKKKLPKFASIADFIGRVGIDYKNKEKLIAYINFIYMCKDRYGKYQSRGVAGKRHLQGHHIVPKSIGGQTLYTNMVWLAPDEHAYAHYLFGEAIVEISKDLNVEVEDKTTRKCREIVKWYAKERNGNYPRLCSVLKVWFHQYDQQKLLTYKG